MKVCVFGLRGFPLVGGGVEKHCEALYPLMEETDLVVFRRRAYAPATDVSYPNIRFADLPSTRVKGFETVLHSFLAARKAVREKPDAVHIHNIGPALFSPFVKRHSVPVILTYHSPNYEHSKWGPAAKMLLRYCEKTALKNADRIIFVNRFQMEKYPEDIQRKSVYIPNGAGRAQISCNTDFLEKHNLRPGEYLLSVGRLTPEKGFDVLIKAFYASGIEGKLVIAGGAGSGNRYSEKLKKLCEDDRVVFTGSVFGDDLAQLYTNASRFVMASLNEGFPLVLLEAMSYGLDILASDIPAAHLAEIDRSCYFPAGDWTALAERLKTEAVDREYDLSGFDWKTIAARTEKIYREAIYESTSDK